MRQPTGRKYICSWTGALRTNFSSTSIRLRNWSLTSGSGSETHLHQWNCSRQNWHFQVPQAPPLMDTPYPETSQTSNFNFNYSLAGFTRLFIHSQPDWETVSIPELLNCLFPHTNTLAFKPHSPTVQKLLQRWNLHDGMASHPGCIL